MIENSERNERPHKSTTHEEMFFHIFWDPSATARGYKGATVFCRKENDGCWCAQVALCAPTDQFCRRVGRSQARRRYFRDSNELGLFYIGPEKPTYDQAEELARDVAAGVSIIL